MNLNTVVRQYWEQEPCGTGAFVVGNSHPGSREWFEKVERHRYDEEPHIFAAAQFTRWAGRRMLEVGVGAGCDHLQFARAGAHCHGIDLTDAAIDTTRRHLALYGLDSHLQRADAEHLPFESGEFELVYSWGVLHHSEHPEAAVREVHRVLGPNGTFVGMFYNRHSLVAYKLWLWRALLAGRPTRTLADVLWHHMESVGTKAYDADELKQMFRAFRSVQLTPVATVYDRKWMGPFGAFAPDHLGWNYCVRAVR